MLAAVAAGLVGLSIVLAFFVAPEDADQGISQRIFYFHVPIALTAYACFGWGAWKALLLLWTREERYDLESYVAIHQGTIFGALTLVTGSIWAKASWGDWWVWDSNQLVLFLVLFLFYSRLLHAPLLDRGGAAARERLRRLRALRGRADPGQLPRDPARRGLHPPDGVHARRAADDRDDVLHLLRLLGRDHDARLRPLPGRARRQAARREPARAARGADDMSSGEKYVAAAYGVVFVTVLVYVVIIAAKLARLERETAELAELARGEPDARWLSSSSSRRCSPTARPRSPTRASSAGPGLAGRLATWGVRLGWLAQTALLVGQAASADGFPWGTWAGSLNLFVWLVVGAYLIWGCTPRYRLLGLAVMPVAAALLALAWAGGGTALDESERSGAVLAVHVALMLAGFAGLTLAAGMAALYLWQERRLKRHERGVLRVRVPPLDALDRLAARSVLGSLVLLTLGIGVGAARFQRGDFDAAMAVTFVILGVLRGAARASARGLARPPRARSSAWRASCSSPSSSL